MAEPDIPIAYGTPIPIQPVPAPIANLATATNINGGSHSRIGLPDRTLSSKSLSQPCLRELSQQGYTKGLAKALMQNKQAFPLRIWVVDNSGSMSHRDGHRLVSNNSTSPHKKELKVLPCTRWTELQQTVDYHAQIAASLQAPTVFRLLNDPGRIAGPQQFGIAQGMVHDGTMSHDVDQFHRDAFQTDMTIDEELALAMSTLSNTSPGGVTPLTGHLREIRQNVKALEPQLRRDGTKVVIVLATDGIPTDSNGRSNDSVKREFVQTLRSLEGLPVWVVVRLCTDEDAVVDFWNNLDSELELSLEVLDDFMAEAQEIHEHNKWLNYGLPLHRMREMGFHHRLFDLLDERKLAKDELFEFFRILFGTDAMDGVPEPDIDWHGFLERITELLAKEQRQWNPMTRRMEPWVDVRRLKREYAPSMFSRLW